LTLGRSEGLPTECNALFDNVETFPVSLLTRRMGALGDGRMHEICEAMSAAIGC
jgi:mRNA-degrading endonuclease toxin of MazEF toxin-antitoxin module